MASKLEHHEKNSLAYYRVRRDLDILKSKKGYHTELISLYIPYDRPLSAVSNYLKNELSESSNIKSKTTRKHVTDAITSLLQTLKTLPPSDTGYVLFDGFIPRSGPGTEREEKYIIIPPEPNTLFKYHCASEFYLEPLEEMLKDRKTYGLISIGRKEAAIALLRGRHVEIVTELTSGIHGKHRAGGQSQRRFERLIEEAAREFYKRIGKHANQIFSEVEDLEGVIVGGPGYTKYEWLEGPFLRQEYKDKVLGTPDTDSDGALGIRPLLQKAEEILRETEFMKEKQLINKFMGQIAKETGMVVYGLHETLDALKAAAVDKLLLSEGIRKVHVFRKCNGCGREDHFFMDREEGEKKLESLNSGECPECNTGHVNADVKIEDLVDYFGDLANEMGTEVTIVSTDTEEGMMFFQTFGGIGGFLRYKYG